MKTLLLAAAGAVVSVLAFPPYGPGIMIFAGVTLLMIALRLASSRTQGLLIGAIYGLVFFGWLMWWLVELEVIALVLVPVQAAFIAAYGWWLVRYNDRSPGRWLALAVGGWGLMELIRYYFPVGGLEWGAAGYALSDNRITRLPAALIGTSGLTLLVVMVSGLLALALLRSWSPRLWVAVGLIGLVVVLAPISGSLVSMSFPGPEETIVQGSTPCPYENCPPDERLGTFEQHLTMTEALEPSFSWLTVWSEGSTGSVNADPVQNPTVGEAIGEQARRLDSWFVVGSDRPISANQWINANVYFNPEGEIVGEYRKQHPVPFGEYIPFRPLFEWIPALDRVPRDMIRGDGPFVVDTGETISGVEFKLGSVISFEGGFSRYSLENRREGANILVVATNEASYGSDAPTSDQFIGMTRMRAVENGFPVVHAAVTGKSAIISSSGEILGITGLGTMEVLTEQGGLPVGRTVFSYIGDSVLYLVAILGVVVWWRTRSLVGSSNGSQEEE
ncbi:MAG: apolipoprotein N-acyltransferase [Acidimicrobiia bacterium]